MSGKENGAGAGAENGAAFGGKLADGVEQTFFLEELELRGAFAAGEDESVGLAEISDGADLEGLCAQCLESGSMGGEITLDGEDADVHQSYQFSVISFGGAHPLQKQRNVGHPDELTQEPVIPMRNQDARTAKDRPPQTQAKCRFLAALGMTTDFTLSVARGLLLQVSRDRSVTTD